ncbi:MFS transporter [Sphingomonas sp. MMS24-JH45]
MGLPARGLCRHALLRRAGDRQPADRFGRRRVLLVSLLCFAADYAMVFAPTLAWLFLGRAIAGIAGATYAPANAVIADVTPPEKRGAVFGLLGAAFGGGFILGPAAGGLLVGLGARAPFVAAAALALVNAALIFALMPETLAPERRRAFDWRRANVFGAFRPLIHAGGATALLLGALVWQIAHMVYPATWAFYGEIALGWDAGDRLVARRLRRVDDAGAGAAGRPRDRALRRGAHGADRARRGCDRVPGLRIRARGVAGLCADRGGSRQGLLFPSINAILSARVDASNQGASQGGLASLSSIAAIVGPLAMTQALAVRRRARLRRRRLPARQRPRRGDLPDLPVRRGPAARDARLAFAPRPPAEPDVEMRAGVDQHHFPGDRAQGGIEQHDDRIGDVVRSRREFLIGVAAAIRALSFAKPSSPSRFSNQPVPT